MVGISSELARYIINGLVATAAHYGVLSFNLTVLELPSAGLANLLAACVGISVSFLGSRYYVYRKLRESIYAQAAKFSGLYGAIAALHGLVLLFWTDWLRLDYTLGFLMATVLQVFLSYSGNKHLVFKT